MEARVARLEAHAEHIQEGVADLKNSLGTLITDVSAAKVDLARLTVRVDHLPSKGFILTSLIGAAGLVLVALTILKAGWLTP